LVAEIRFFAGAIDRLPSRWQNRSRALYPERWDAVDVKEFSHTLASSQWCRASLDPFGSAQGKLAEDG
jgi:hypothetical protein